MPWAGPGLRPETLNSGPKPGPAYENEAEARGRGHDLAEKTGFSDFLGHVGPLARAKEGRVDFDHANFSRRSHPCHPEFLPLGRMSKS